MPPVLRIEFGLGFGAALHEDGRIRVWGALPHDPMHYVTRPTLLSGLDHVRSIDAGGYHLIAVQEDGSTWIWGDPDGPGLAEQGPINPPALVPTIGGVRFARPWPSRTFLATHDGRVFGMGGYGGRGVMWDGEGVPADVPVEIPSLRDVIDIQLGFYHSMALRSDGRVLTWGRNDGGQLGDDTPPDGRIAPEIVPGIDDVIGIAARQGTSIALRRDGTVWQWGGAHWQLGNEVPSTSEPFQVPGLHNIRAVRCGNYFGIALREDGTLFGWGTNLSNLLGFRSPDPVVPPVELEVRDVTQVFAGPWSVQVLTQPGLRWAWGELAWDGRTTVPRHPIPIWSK